MVVPLIVATKQLKTDATEYVISNCVVFNIKIFVLLDPFVVGIVPVYVVIYKYFHFSILKLIC